MYLNRSLVSIFALAAALTGVSQYSYGWGSYGHEQVNSGAIDVLKKTHLGACLQTNRDLMLRLAITPDYEWKTVGTAPSDPLLKAKRAKNDHYEHPLHFFEADAFVTPDQVSEATIAALPVDSEYSKVFAQYRKLLLANIDTVLKVDPSKALKDPKNPSTVEVTEHGSAPWRIQQLYDLGVKALVAGDMEMALVYLGTMGHYVGDMSQPFHASLNFDGQYYDPTAAGIHHTFEEAILEEAGKAAGATQDKSTKLWSTFAATEGEVVAKAKELFVTAKVNRSSLLSSVMQLVGSGYNTITPLLAAFTYAKDGELGGYPDATTWRVPPIASRVKAPARTALRATVHAKTPHTPKAAIRAFMELDYLKPAKKTPTETVLQLANERMGASSALLAQLWVSAVSEATKAGADLSALASCDAQEFNQATVINKYPIPLYLEKL